MTNLRFHGKGLFEAFPQSLPGPGIFMHHCLEIPSAMRAFIRIWRLRRLKYRNPVSGWVGNLGGGIISSAAWGRVAGNLEALSGFTWLSGRGGKEVRSSRLHRIISLTSGKGIIS